jgi:ADP-heptose:LPS heptosyltransferase
MKERLQRLWFLLSVVVPLWLRTFRRPVLFSRLGALGDIICTFPAALELKKRHPRAAFIYSCLPDFARLPEMGGITTQITSVQFASNSRWRFFFAMIYEFRYADEIAGETCRQTTIEDFCSQFGLAKTDEHPRLQPNPPALARVNSFLAALNLPPGPRIFFHLGPSWPVRQWPLAAWADLAEKLRARGFANLIHLGVNKHVEMGSAAAEDVPGTISLVNQLTVEETVAMISLGSLVVGIDSGLLHIAASTRTPAVGVFGPTSPEFRFGKGSSCSVVVSDVECQGCHHRVPRLHWRTGCPYDIACMKNIQGGEVVQACLAKLGVSEALDNRKT